MVSIDIQKNPEFIQQLNTAKALKTYPDPNSVKQAIHREEFNRSALFYAPSNAPLQEFYKEYERFKSRFKGEFINGAPDTMFQCDVINGKLKNLVNEDTAEEGLLSAFNNLVKECVEGDYSLMYFVPYDKARVWHKDKELSAILPLEHPNITTEFPSLIGNTKALRDHITFIGSNYFHRTPPEELIRPVMILNQRPQ